MDDVTGRASPPEGRRLRWVWAAGFLLLCGSGGVVFPLATVGTGLTGGFWLIAGLYLVVAVGFGAGMGLLLRRRLGWRQSAWRSRVRQLSWGQRLRVAWAMERARAVDDPELARAAVERSEFALRSMARMDDWFLLVTKVAAVLAGIMVVLLVVVVLAFDGWRSDPEDWVLVAILVVAAGLAAALPWLHRKMWGWSTRRLERTLALNREAAARAGGTDESTGRP